MTGHRKSPAATKAGAATAAAYMDSAALGAALHQAGRITPARALTAALGWERQRLDAAADALGEQLPSVGLRLVRRDGLLGLAAVGSSVATSSATEVARARYAKDGMSVGVARVLLEAVRHLVEGQGQLRAEGNAQRVALAELLNAGLLTPDLRPARCLLSAIGLNDKISGRDGRS